MKGKAKRMKKIGLLIFLIFILTAVLSFFSCAADDGFEKSIAAFPESYKPYLRELHAKYPNWVFEPMITGLDWNVVVTEEYGEVSLVQSSATSKIFKSYDSDDYNFDTGSFVFKDGGFVQANMFAVEYFMDPRNFLTEDGIFQFELLGFSENYSIEMIERVLKGSFMSNTKIEYLKYNESKDTFTTVKTDETYAEVIYDAGKTYNINPCYLASKILNELGSDGSYSVYGDHPTYPGIYNFYNIGATDGSGAIARGLLWAKGGTANKTTYGRPWNTPRKSIVGGAQFLSEEYIAKGQYTGYLQRFNVNPDGYYNLYSHQYMTNLTGALSQGYSTYASYAALGMLDGSITFSIPVYENMSGQDDNTGRFDITDAKCQYGVVNSTRAVLRTGPAKSYANVKSSAGSNVTVTTGTEVKILSKDFTDSKYYLNILACPIWYKVSLTVGSATYEGYIDGDFIDISTTTFVPTGSFDFAYFTTNYRLFGGLISSDYRYCTVTDNDTVNFLKNGTVFVSSYNSSGGYDKVKYTVSKDDYAVKNLKTSVTADSITVSITKHASSEKSGFYLKNEANGKLVKAVGTASSKYTFKNLKSGSSYTVFVRYMPDYGYTNGMMTKSTVITKPQKATNLAYTFTSDEGLVLKWDKAEKCTGYKIYSYNKTTGKYTRIGTVKSNTGKFAVSESHSDKTCFMVRSYVTYDGVTVNGSYSEHLEIRKEMTAPTALALSGVTSKGYTLSWEGTSNVDGYRVYRYIPETKKYIVVADTENTYLQMSDIEPGYLCAYRVKGFRTVDSQTELSPRSAALWALLPTLKPETLSASDVQKNSITVSWGKTVNADKYRVYIYDSKKGEGMLVAETAETFLTVDGLSEKTEYKFWVTAVAEGRGMSFESENSDVLIAETLSAEIKLSVVEGISAASHKQTSLKLSWQEVEFAEGYRVYQRKSGAWKLICETPETSYKVTGLTPGTLYDFTVKAYAYQNGKKTMSPSYITFKTATRAAVPTQITSTPGITSMKLTWNAVQGATGYKIYYFNTSKNGWKAVETVTDNSYTVSDLKSATTYTFAIKPYIKVGDKVVWSSYARYVDTTRCEIPLLSVTSPSVGTVSFSWTNVSRETGYQIWYSDNSGETYKKISNFGADKVSAKKSGLVSGETYLFKIRAYKKVTDGYVYSKFGSVQAVTVL